MGKTAPQAPAVPNPNASGALLVVVKDPSGVGIKDCTVRLHRPKTNDDVEQQTDDTGSTLFDALPPAPDYGVLITKKGFGTVPAAGAKWFENGLSGIASVIPGPDISDIGGVMRQNKAKLTVKVIDATTNLPLGGASVGVDGTTGTPMPLSAPVTGVVGPFVVDADVKIRFHAQKAGMGPAPGGLPMGGVIDDRQTLAFQDDKTFELRLHQASLITPTLDQAKLVVFVKKADTTPKRQKLVLSCDVDFDGTGVLKATGGGSVHVFDAATGGNAILFSREYTGAELRAGFTVFIEGAKASTKMNDLTLELVLSGGSKNPTGTAKTLVTVVDATLDICRSRTSATADPAPMSAADKVNVGRFVHKQIGTRHGRAKLIVRQLKPADFSGVLTLSPRPGGGGVTLFDKAEEVPAAGQTALPTPQEFAASTVTTDGLVFWAEGSSTSSALRDTGFRLGVKGVEDDGDHVRMTVCEFTNLTASVGGTPPNTVRTTPVNNAAPARQTFVRTGGSDPSFDEDFTLGNVLVLLENSTPDPDTVQLSVTVAPAATPVKWEAHRDNRPAKGDAAAVAALSPAPKPTVTPQSDPKKAFLKADAVGSFHLCAYVDGNGSGTQEFNDASGARIDREPFILMSLALVRVRGDSNTSIAQGFNFGFGPAGGGRPAVGATFAPSSLTGLRLESGAGSSTTPGQDAVNNIATVAIVGGGPDGMRGLEETFGGWVNNEAQAEDVGSIYDPAPAVGPQCQRISIMAIPAKSYGPSQTPAIIRPAPFLDTSVTNGGVGGNGCIGTEGQAGPSGPPTGGAHSGIRRVVQSSGIGELWTIQMWDSPGDACPPTQGFLPGRLASYRFNLFFRCDLVFWTNLSRSRSGVADAASQLYVTVQTNTWTIAYSITFPATGAAPLQTAANATVAVAKDPNPQRLARAVKGSGLEVRNPSVLPMLSNDCRL